MPLRGGSDGPPRPRRAAGDQIENFPAYVGLCCGIASLVPWVFVLTFPLAVVFGLAGLWRSFRLESRQGRRAAVLGIAIGLGAGALHFLLVGTASLIGLIRC